MSHRWMGLVLIGLVGCSSGYREQRDASERGDRGAFWRRSLERADAGPRLSQPPADPARDAAIAELKARADRWIERDTAHELSIGFSALEGQTAQDRCTELAEPARGEAVLTAGAALPDLERLAALRNHEVLAAHGRWRAQIEMFEQAEFLEDLLRQFNAFSKSLATGLGEPMHQTEVQAEFPFPATTTLKGELADREADRAWHERRMILRDVLVEVGLVYHSLQYVEHALAVTRESRELMAGMEQVARTRYEAGASGQIDLLRIGSELSQTDTELVDLEQQRTTARARLNTLLARLPDAELGPVQEFETAAAQPELENMLEIGLRCRQELMVKRVEVARDELALRLAETVVYPRASAGASLAQIGMTREAGPDRGEGIFPNRPEVEPRWSYGADAAYLQQLRRDLDAARQSLLALEDRVRFEIKELHFLLGTTRRQVQLFETSLVPQAEQALVATRSAYETGKLGFLDFIEARRTALDARLGLEAARRDWHQATTRVLGVVGVNVER